MITLSRHESHRSFSPSSSPSSRLSALSTSSAERESEEQEVFEFEAFLDPLFFFEAAAEVAAALLSLELLLGVVSVVRGDRPLLPFSFLDLLVFLELPPPLPLPFLPALPLSLALAPPPPPPVVLPWKDAN